MKKYLLAAALVMASASAMADRVVSGSGDSDTPAKACREAKDAASGHTSSNEEVKKFGQCICSEKDGRAYCTVDATIGRRD